VQARRVPSCEPGPDNFPALAIGTDRDRSVAVGVEQGDARARQQVEDLGMGVPVLVAAAKAGDGEPGPDHFEPSSVGAFAQSVVGQLQGLAAGAQLGDAVHPPAPLLVLGIPGQEQGY
jgi:hypothetical protein